MTEEELIAAMEGGMEAAREIQRQSEQAQRRAQEVQVWSLAYAAAFAAPGRDAVACAAEAVNHFREWRKQEETK